LGLFLTLHPEREGDVVGAEVVSRVASVVALVGALHVLDCQSVLGIHNHPADINLFLIFGTNHNSVLLF
jgi:hypothetical protein